MLFDDKGILGINARNLLYIRPYNPKKAIKLADDKIRTKQFLSARGIPVPKLFGIIHNSAELQKYDFNTLTNPFVIKPNQGYGGEGIIPIISRKEGKFIAAGNKEMTVDEIREHIVDILDGRFSLSNLSDYAFFEQYIIADERLGKYSYEGLPDIRVIVHNLIPVMAMLRLPTKESGGKANLHMGAVGVGIDIARGETTNIVYKNHIIEELPGGLGKIRGLKIPFWDEILLIASKIQLATNLGYMAVDISIDKNSGPVLLEINARAGLSVQIANLAPLRRRLERIEGLKVPTPEKGVRIAKDMFGISIEKEIEHVSGKQVIGIEEEVEIIQKKETLRLKAQIDPRRQRSVLDEDTALKAKLLENSEGYDDEKSTLKTKFSLKNTRIQTVVDIEKMPEGKHKMIIGRRDLNNFLIDPENFPKEEKTTSNVPSDSQSTKTNYREIDEKLIEVDGKIKLLYHLRPLNLDSEKEKFLKNPSFNPQFEYPVLKFNPLELIEILNTVEPDSSPLGQIFSEKKEELMDKIALLEAMDEFKFAKISIKLFGKPLAKEVEFCKDNLKEKVAHIPENKHEKTYPDKEALKIFEEALQKYNLNDWHVAIKEGLVSDCVAGKNNRLFIKKGTNFSESRIKSLIVHEIETHILTAENGKNQPYQIFNRGTANYLTTQEGLAIYNSEKQKQSSFEGNIRVMMNVIAIAKALEASFLDTFYELIALGVTSEQAFRSTLKAKRGYYDTGKIGAFTKDYLYFKGYNQIIEFVKDGGFLEDLYIGKINLSDLPLVKQIHGIVPPKILPEWLNK